MCFDKICDEINKLIRSISDPHPGVFTFSEKNKIFIEKAINNDLPFK